MRRVASRLLLSATFCLTVSGCTSSPLTATAPPISTVTPIPPAPTPLPKETASPPVEPTIDPSGWEGLQQGNDLPITEFHPRQSFEIEDNMMGDMVNLTQIIKAEGVAGFVARISEKGLKWMRLSLDPFDWNEVSESASYSRFSIAPEIDQAIDTLLENDIRVMLTLVFWDEAIQIDAEDYARFQEEDEIQRYLDYVQFIAHHFKGRIAYYELLNEPNIGDGDQQYVQVPDYIQVAQRAIPVIRREDPEAKIVVGAVTPFYCIEDEVRFEPCAREYLFTLLESDVMPLVDAISWHALGGASPSYGEEYYYSYPGIVQEIQQTATAHGFQGEYIAEELHWRTASSPHSHEYSEYDEIVAAKYLARGIVMHLGMGLRVGLAENLENPPKMEVIQNLATIMAGAEPADLAIEIQGKAVNMRSYGFSLPTGDHLVALWTDGRAVEDDSGQEATLVVQELSVQRVIAIDILSGIEQELVVQWEENDLVIPGLLVRDYPIVLLLLTDPSA